MNLIIGISGASGALYGKSFLKHLVTHQPGASALIISDAALKVYNQEYGTKITSREEYLEQVLEQTGNTVHSFTLYHPSDYAARPASGSARYDAMVIVPCSMKTLAGIRHGLASSLMERAADVCLKEKRPLILVPRETPFNEFQLENMHALSRAGVVIAPASPGFYQHPRNLEDLGRFMTGRIFNLLKIEHSLFQPWEGLS
ncbi:MAG: UbiX family flavin prenyltransferase [Spirochaetales bacterium]|nr:UbiX family flavin prenyltransferase [Spirochaetales bacterium]